MSTTTETAGAWVSWYRPYRRHPWRPLLRGATEAEAQRRALALDLAGDWTTLMDGIDPNERPGRDRR